MVQVADIIETYMVSFPASPIRNRLRLFRINNKDQSCNPERLRLRISDDKANIGYYKFVSTFSREIILMLALI